MANVSTIPQHMTEQYQKIAMDITAIIMDGAMVIVVVIRMDIQMEAVVGSN